MPAVSLLTITLGELAERFALTVTPSDQPATPLSNVATLQNARSTDISFFTNAKYRDHYVSTRAGAVLVKAKDAPSCPTIALVCDDPYASYARIANFFHPLIIHPAGIHPSAVIESGAQIHPSAHVGAQCFVDAQAIIAEGASVQAMSFVGPNCKVGAYSELKPRVTLVKRVELGRCVTIHSGAVLGADGFGFAPDQQSGWLKIPQIGRVMIGDGCDIGANTTIDCGAIDDTVIGKRVILDNQIQVGHNVEIGDYTAIAGCTAIAGTAKIGKRCLIAGGVGIAGHLEICDQAVVLAMSLVTSSITEPGAYAAAMPLMPQRDWQRASVRLKQLDAILKARQTTKDSA
jgi:UDP-3-O-[3-hydroxymyristoyl] glucosamine N-acyltransferase